MNSASILSHEPSLSMLRQSLFADIGDGDLTTDAIFVEAQAQQVHLTARSGCVVCGMALIRWYFEQLDAQVQLEVFVEDGDQVEAMSRLATFRGDIRSILKIERSLLNTMMRLSGIATAAHKAQAQVPQGLKAKVLDTRKTLPGWRHLDKWAVKCGGGFNHRMGLHDMVLIKDNHIAAAGSVSEAIKKCQSYTQGKVTIEVEIDGLFQLEEALSAGPDIILLDNFSLADLKEAVERVDGRALCEASGGVRMETIADIAKTGVDRISMGALTHTVVPADLAFDMDTP